MDSQTRKKLLRVAFAAQFVADDIDPERLFTFGNADDMRETVAIHERRVITRFDARILIESLIPVLPVRIIGADATALEKILSHLPCSLPPDVCDPFFMVVYALNALSLHTEQPAESVNRKIVSHLRDAGKQLEDVLTFVPTPLEVMILDSLNGKALTVDELQEACHCSRPTLYGGKTKKDGIKNLLSLGRIAKRKKGGGLYRPDAPPAEC